MRILKNKKGYSLSGWVEGILLALLVVTLLGLFIGGFNGLYDKNHDIGLGGNSTTEAFIDYQESLESEITQGEAEFTSDEGLTLKSTWAILKSLGTIVWDFLTGGWIETATNYMKLPVQVGLIFRILYFVSIGLIILYLLLKVKP